MRRGVKFHNGEDFNAQSAKFSLERVMDPKTKLKQSYHQDYYERIEIMDDYTIRIITKNFRPYLDKKLCYVPAMIPRRYFQEKSPSDIAKNPVGSGPYKFVRWTRDDHILLEANEHYWRGAPPIKKVLFRPIPEPMSRIAGLQTKELDIIADVPHTLTRLIDRKRGASVSTAPGMTAIFLGFDTTKGGPVADKRVRKAIAHAIDLDSIIKKVVDGYGIKLALPIPPTFVGHNPHINPYPYNPEEAKRLLGEAGYTKGFDFSLHTASFRREIAEAAAGYLQKVGINASVKVHEFGLFMSKLYAHDVYPSYLMAVSNADYDAGSTFYHFVRSNGQWSNYHNPKMDAMIDEARFTLENPNRLKALNDVCLFAHEEVLFAFSYQQIYLYGLNEPVNWQARPDQQMHVFDMSFKR